MGDHRFGTQDSDHEVRLAAFRWLSDQVLIHGDVLPYRVLQKGLTFRGQRVPLLGPQGIFKPRIMSLPLSITTAPHGPYDDSFGADNLIHYKYRGQDPTHRDNVGLKQAMAMRTPLVYLHGIMRGRYLAIWPAFVVGADDATLTFSVEVDEARTALQVDPHDAANVAEESARRRYITSTVRRRLHQRGFRERVLDAYRDQCALCRLRHRELLDAAHIVPDAEEAGEPVVSNGLALCKIHHAAYDAFLLGISPDYKVAIRQDVLAEVDGPMLKHGLQGLHDSQILLPRSVDKRPDRDRLAARWKRFRDVA